MNNLCSMHGDSLPIWGSFIKEACNTIKGSRRKNVNKFLIRKMLRFIQRDKKKYSKYMMEKCSGKEKEFERVFEICRELEYQEKVKESGIIKKDYGRVVNEIIANPPFHLLFNKVLEEVLEEFREKGFGNIVKKNHRIYLMTVELLYKCSSAIIKKQLFTA